MTKNGLVGQPQHLYTPNSMGIYGRGEDSGTPPTPTKTMKRGEK